jgi:hypothetical protein
MKVYNARARNNRRSRARRRSLPQIVLDFDSWVGEGNIATLVCCELLADVHQLCETTGPKSAGSGGSELGNLRRYLGHERGWRCLAVLQLLGVRELTCVRELVTLLVALYPLLASHELDEDRSGPRNPYLRFYPNDDGLVDALDTLDITLQKKKRRRRRKNAGMYDSSSSISVSISSLSVHQNLVYGCFTDPAVFFLPLV